MHPIRTRANLLVAGLCFAIAIAAAPQEASAGKYWNKVKSAFNKLRRPAAPRPVGGVPLRTTPVPALRPPTVGLGARPVEPVSPSAASLRKMGVSQPSAPKGLLHGTSATSSGSRSSMSPLPSQWDRPMPPVTAADVANLPRPSRPPPQLIPADATARYRKTIYNPHGGGSEYRPPVDASNYGVFKVRPTANEYNAPPYMKGKSLRSLNQYDDVRDIRDRQELRDQIAASTPRYADGYSAPPFMAGKGLPVENQYDNVAKIRELAVRRSPAGEYSAPPFMPGKGLVRASPYANIADIPELAARRGGRNPGTVIEKD